MTTRARIASALIAASAFVFPLSAFAENRAPEGHQNPQESSFPMKAAAYKKLVNGRIEKLKGHLEQGLEKRSLTAEQKADIEKSMDGAMKELHAAVDKVGADGVVTRDEAKQVKDLSDHLRSKMRAELRGKHASAKVKGGKSAKGKGNKGKSLSKKVSKETPKDK